MKKLIIILLLSHISSFTYGQLSLQVIDTLNYIDKLIQDLPNSRRGNQYVKYRLEYEKDYSTVKIITDSYDYKTNEKINQNNISTFKLEDIDPNAILIRAYNSSNIMLQLICKENNHNVNNVFIYEGKQMGNSKIDRASINSYNPKEYKQKLERIKNAFIYVVKSNQKNSSKSYVTDTTDMKTIIKKINDKTEVIELTKIKANKGSYVFGTMETPPVFLNSKSPKETEINARNYLIDLAMKEKHTRHGKVFISFFISENGKINDIQILKGVDKELDKLSIKITKSMPVWTPGMIDGKKVITKFNTNIEF